MPLPKIHLLCYHEPDLKVFKAARDKYAFPQPLSITYHTGSLKYLDPAVRFQAVVSPANSYGRMDGGFDDGLSRAFSPKDEYLALTRIVQQHLQKEWHGFAPPGTCTMIPFDVAPSGKEMGHPWGCKLIALSPTMRSPEPISWDREILYRCMWSILCAIDKWNETCGHGNGIDSVLMTPLGTGAGGVSAERWAHQVLLAMKHFMEAELDKNSSQTEWPKVEWPKIRNQGKEVATTHKM